VADETNERELLYVPMMLRHKLEVDMAIHPFASKTEAEVRLPEGCAGILFAFRTREAAIEMYGEGVKLMVISCGDE
jgi:hypothetical protein